MNKAEADAMDDVVRNLIDRTINTLMAAGATKDAALRLLAIQAIIRMQDAEICKVQQFIDQYSTMPMEGDD